MLRHRPHLLWLLVPFVLFLVVLPWVNRVDPVILRLPFLSLWLLGATVATPFAVWLTWRGDQRLRRRSAARPISGPGPARPSAPGEGAE
ncbi:DUF3311 domain-containing protein [Streptomyces sp. NPDC088116]|uniref:DUF3311 domain-containing protein n=1 Tax=Streptomyces sp. NPDC088116 TaxID=3365825 RepID=UPI0037FA561F